MLLSFDVQAASDDLAEQLAAKAILEAEDELRDKVPADPTDEASELQALQALVNRLQTERDYLVQKDRSQQAELEELREQVSVKLQDDVMESEWKSRCERLEVQIKAADADMAKLRLQVAKSGELDFDADSRDKNVEEQVPNLRSPPEEGGRYEAGGQPCKDTSLAQPPELPSSLLALDSPGVYVVSQTVALTVGPEKSSAKLQNLNVGTAVQVLEVVHQQEDKRVRGRVEDPAGWISIVGTEDSNRWASRDLQRSNRSASLRSEQLLSLQRELNALETAMEEAKSAATKEAQKSKEEEESFRAAAAEDLSRCEQQLREKSERCRTLELELKQASLQLDGPGVYLLASDVDVSEALARSSQKLGRLLAGEEVHILEVVHRKAEKRVRGRVAAKGYSGWISLMDMSEGYRWAHRQLSATNEWISGLLEKSAPLACETELRARCAALEADGESRLGVLSRCHRTANVFVRLYPTADLDPPSSRHNSAQPAISAASSRLALVMLCGGLGLGGDSPKKGLSDPFELRRLIDECTRDRLRDLEQRLETVEKRLHNVVFNAKAELEEGLQIQGVTTASAPVRLPFRHEPLEISTAPDDDRDAVQPLPKDRQNNAEYRFDACVWDSCVLVGLGILSWQESLAVAFCGLWSILVEGFFVLILYDNMTETVFESSLAEEMRDWRIHFGQNINYIDAITGQPLIMGVCSMSNSLMNGNVQAEIYETMFKYGIRETGNQDLRWPLLPVGAWLALIALLVWIFTVLKEMSCACGFGIALASLPRSPSVADTVSNPGHFLQLSVVSLHRVVVLIVFNMLPRLSIALVLGIIGVHFLASTTSLSDLILNAVALEVVLCIDDLFFAVLVPRRVHETIKSLKPIPVKLWRPWVLQARQAFIFTLSLACLVGSHVLCLQPLVNNMQATADAMCSGVTNFTYFQDAAGLAYILDDSLDALPKKSDEGYAYRAVLQATQLQEVQPPGLGAQLLNRELFGLAMQLKSLGFEERSEFWPLCQDLDSPVYSGFGLVNLGTAAMEKLRELLPEAAAIESFQSCPSVQSFCFNGSLHLETLWRLRALCPVTCGCNDLKSGSFIASLPSFGCPSVCRTLFDESVTELATCSDAPTNSEALKTFLHGLRQRKGIIFRSNSTTCEAFATPVNIDGTDFDFCMQTAELGKMGFQSSQLLCPAHRDSILLELPGHVSRLEQLQTVGAMSASHEHGGPGHPTGMENSASELQDLRANVMVLEAGRDQLELQAELLRTKYQTLEAEYEEFDCLRLGPGVGSWRDLHPHFHLHLISCCVIRSSHTARAGPGPSRIISFCFRMPFLWSGILGIKFSSHLRRRRHQHHFVSFNNIPP
ncbi:unnamed protein product [Symbiodinium necroappetens]|uniref:Uncharacterized protein n=1 Tax=Symbiodinium necroappetens TaxID=1628268 RepID=A0A812VJZ9_9DINO|nr:unnamed protein product [Symbiodinium necroappetens]